MGPEEGSIEEPLTALIDLKRQGLIRHLGLSNVSPSQLTEAQAITEIVCIQNFYNVAHRIDDAFITDLAAQGIPYVPFFPLGGFTPLQSSSLTQQPPRSTPRPCRSHSLGFCTARRTSCSYPAPLHSHIFVRISRRPRYKFLLRHSPLLTQSA